MSSRYGALPDPSGDGGYLPQNNDEEDPRSYPLYKDFEEYLRRNFENSIINTGIYCSGYDECMNGINVNLSAVQKAGREFRTKVESFPGSPHVEADSEFNELDNRDNHFVFLAWPTQRRPMSSNMGRIFSPSGRGMKLYDQPRTIILAMAATILVATLSTTGEQWLLLGTKVGLL